MHHSEFVENDLLFSTDFWGFPCEIRCFFQCCFCRFFLTAKETLSICSRGDMHASNSSTRFLLNNNDHRNWIYKNSQTYLFEHRHSIQKSQTVVNANINRLNITWVNINQIEHVVFELTELIITGKRQKKLLQKILTFAEFKLTSNNKFFNSNPFQF